MQQNLEIIYGNCLVILTHDTIKKLSKQAHAITVSNVANEILETKNIVLEKRQHYNFKYRINNILLTFEKGDILTSKIILSNKKTAVKIYSLK